MLIIKWNHTRSVWSIWFFFSPFFYAYSLFFCQKFIFWLSVKMASNGGNTDIDHNKWICKVSAMKILNDMARILIHVGVLYFLTLSLQRRSKGSDQLWFGPVTVSLSQSAECGYVSQMILVHRPGVTVICTQDYLRTISK